MTDRKLSKEEVEFLRQSNMIEAEYSIKALNDAKNAWCMAMNGHAMSLERVMDIHLALLRRLDPRIAGRMRRVDVMVGGRVCPDPDKARQMLIGWLMSVNDSFHDEWSEEAIRQHHIDFEHIHPFEDGNGRVGRILMNWQRVKAGMPVLIIREADKQAYYSWFA